jgi:DNA polymerase-3 subunit alpha
VNATGPNAGVVGAGAILGTRIPKNGLFVRFATREEYDSSESELLNMISDSDGNDDVIIYINEPKSIKVLPPNLRVNADEALAARLKARFGEGNIVIK